MSERERFYQWAKSEELDVEHDPDVDGIGEVRGIGYADGDTEIAHQAWQARARIAEQENEQLVRGLEAIRDYGDSSGRLGIYPEQHEAKYPEFAGDMDEAEIADAVLNESAPQSAAKVKAEVLRWAAANVCKGNDSGYFVCDADDLLSEADRLEREAKEAKE